MKKLVLLMAFLLFAGTANAMVAAPDVVAQWDMTGQPGTQVFTDGIDSDYATAENMVRGSGLLGNTGVDSMNSKGWDGTDAGDYFEFGFSVGSGYQVDLSQLWIGTRSSSTGPGTIGVYTSLDSYTTAAATLIQQNTTVLNSILDLRGLGPITGDFYVRLMEIGDTQAGGSGATASTGTFRVADYYDGSAFTDVQFTGYVSQVPVPGAFWLLGSCLVGVWGARRKFIK
ncbi:MAG: hypothetical protein V2B19_23285 [Pseudomonadota bacterium]